MPKLMPFRYESHEIRVEIDPTGEPWWVAKDVCEALEITNYRQALARLDADEKGVCLMDTPGGKQDMATVNESGLYNLILGSRKQEAKAFKRWVTHEVLPTLRATGQYTLATHTTQDPLHARTATLTYLRAHRDFLDELGMLDDRDKLMLADCARTLLATPTGTALLPTGTAQEDGFFLADHVRTLGYRPTRRQEARLMGILAKKVAAEYRTRHAEEPTKRTRFVDGATRAVNYYPAKEAAWIDVIIQTFFTGFSDIHRAITSSREP
jgi:prophage antirepressor-like protein